MVNKTKFEFTSIVVLSSPYSSAGFELDGIHTSVDPVAAVNNAEAIFIGGGNTFQLLKGLYDNKLIEPIRKRVLQVIVFFSCLMNAVMPPAMFFVFLALKFFCLNRGTKCERQCFIMVILWLHVHEIEMQELESI